MRKYLDNTSKLLQHMQALLKTERIKLPADANIEGDDRLFPPLCLAKLNHGRSVKAVAQPGQGRHRVQRSGSAPLWKLQPTRAHHIKMPGIHPGSTGRIPIICFSKKLTDSLFREPSKQCELIFALLFPSTLSSILPKMGKKRP